MKANRFTLVVLSLVLFVSMACGISQAQPTSATGRVLKVSPTVDMGGAGSVQYWKGAFPVTLTQWGFGNQDEADCSDGDCGILTFQPQMEWTGIPWMVLGYDKISLKITTVVFGLSEVKYKVLNGVTLPYDPCVVGGGAIQGADKLDLKGCILLVTASTQITNSVQQFSFTDLLGSTGFTFAYTSDEMMGSATILKEDRMSMPYSSGTNEIKLYRK